MYSYVHVMCSVLCVIHVALLAGISKLTLSRLDFSGNKISQIPCDLRKMDTLTEISLNNNPLTCPPAHVSLLAGYMPILSMNHMSFTLMPEASKVQT